jgi:hypothetical protein
MNPEQRTSGRKALKSTGHLTLDRSPPLAMRTINLARDGMAISAPERVIEGAHCLVDFDLVLDGEPHQISVGARVIFCVYAGQSQFKAGLRFVDLDLSSSAAITSYLSH